jgi:hypothetical protein
MVVISPHFDVHAIATKPTQLAWADAPSLDDVKKTRQTISDQGFRSFLFLMKLGSQTRPAWMSGCVSAGKFMFPQNVFDPIADRVLSQESEQSLWMLTPNCNFQF